MTDKKIAIFSGSSHFQGLGLEIELSKRYNSIDWLTKNGVNPNQPYITSDMNIHEKYRWSKLLSDKMGIKEWNCYGSNSPLGDGSDIQFFEKLLNDKIDLTNVSYIFQELTSATRLRYEYTIYTPSELLELMKSKKLSKSLKQELEQWLDDNENGLTYDRFKTLFKEVLNKYPKIKFHIINWYGSYFDLLTKDFKNNILNYIDKKSNPNHSFHNGLIDDGMVIRQTAFCYNSNRTWEVNWFDEHANKEGQKHVAEIIYRQINKPII